MSITKKLRFEVFKRDGFKCAYCGKSPPEAVLEADHIDPVSNGGDDKISNLITACFACNRGKSNIKLSKIPPKLSENIEVLQEREDQLREYRKLIAKIHRRQKKDWLYISHAFSEHFEGYQLSDQFMEISIKKFLEHLPLHEVENAMKRACLKFPNDRQIAIKYFCGICWRKIKEAKS